MIIILQNKNVVLKTQQKKRNELKYFCGTKININLYIFYVHI